MGLSADDLLKSRLPEGDTSDADKSAAPDKGTPAKKWAGKYDSPEALESSYTSLESKLGEQGEEIQRLKGLLLSPSTPTDTAQWAPAPTTAVEPSPDGEMWVSRADAEKIATERARTEALRLYNEVSERTYWRDEFFRRHSDLKSYEDLVQAKTAEIGQRYAQMPADWVRARMPLLMDEVASKTRERIAAIRAEAKAEANRQSAELADVAAAGTPAPVAPPPQQVEKTLDELRVDAIREEMEEKARLKSLR